MKGTTGLAIPKESKVATATRSVAREDIFFGTTTRSIAARPRTTIIVTLVYLQGEGSEGERERKREREGETEVERSKAVW